MGLISVMLGGARDAGAWEDEAGEAPQQPQPRPAADAPAPAAGEPTVAFELAGQASYVTPPIRGGATPFGAGFGGRIGLEVSGFYVGLSVLDFLGGRDVDVTYRAMLYGLDVGYGFRVPAFGRAFWLLRPRIGVGEAAVQYTDPKLAADVVTTASGTSSGSDTVTVNNAFVRPALALELVSGTTFVALEGSVLVLPGIAYGGADATTWLTYGAGAELGFRL